MIAFANPKDRSPSDPERFLAMLPTIRRAARAAFDRYAAEAREEAVQEVIANCWQAYARLVQQGRAALAYPTVLAKFAIAHVRAGRCVGTPANLHDLTSRYCQRAHGITVERLDRYEKYRQEWKEVLVEDPKAGPAETAAARMDFAAWLGSLAPRVRQIAQLLATGETTGNTARTFGVSAGRISQLRRGLEAAWHRFQGEPMAAALGSRRGD